MSGPVRLLSATGDVRADDGVCDASELVEQAEATLLQREQDALHDHLSLESRKERIRSLLLTSMEMAEEDTSPETIAELERALEAAQKAGVLPDLRVKARKLLEKQLQIDRRRGRMEVRLQRMVAQLEEVHRTTDEGGGQAKVAGSRKAVARQRREDLLLGQLSRLIDEAARAGVGQPLMGKAKDLARTVEKDRRADDLAARRLQGLLLVDDADALGEKLQLARKHCELTGEGARRVVGEIQERVEHLAMQEQHQQWLSAELAAAAQRSDVMRLKQLFDQAKTLDLTVPPAMVSLLHSLQAAPQTGTRQGKHRDHLARLRSFAARQHEAAEAVVAEAEDNPNEEELDAARRAVANAKQAKVPDEVVLPLERRLATLELQHLPRLQAEEQLRGVLHLADGRPHGAEVLQDSRKVDLLRASLGEAQRCEADPELVCLGVDLLERSLEASEARRSTEDFLRQALARPRRTEADLELLQDAVDEGRRCGIATLHAERELARARDAQVQREAAEAELQEAAKALGPPGRLRLEAAVQTAKAAGVSAEKLRVANARLAQLVEHEQRCTLAAGNIRRALPMLQKEPWRFQQVMETVQALQPWTAELEKLVRDGEHRLEKIAVDQSYRREAQRELQLLLRQIKDARSSGHLCADQMTELSKKLEVAQAASVREEILREAEKQLRSLRREGCQRSVAEHRLRLALKAKDLGEIERSVRQVRALGHAGLIEAGGGVARGERPEQPHSARLMDAASSMLRQLNDAAARRQAAVTALQERVADSGDAGPLRADGPREARPPPPGPSAPARQGSGDWIRDVVEVLHEARQCGVAPTLIEHAKMKIREKRRERKEESQAREALQRSLSKKDAPTQEVLRNLRKVQRLQSAR